METMACLVCGLGLIISGIGLRYLSPPDWQVDGELLEEQRRALQGWSRFQRRIRQWNNAQLGLTGACILVTAWVPHGKTWFLLWCGILLLLFSCCVLAMLDALSSVAGYRRALPEAARRSFGNDSKCP